MSVTKLVLVRHGESKWNNENIFTGWNDVDLSDKGWVEARQAGQILKEDGYIFDIAFTSMLKRAIHTLWSILDQLDQSWLHVEKSWRLNERHYGALQGLNKFDTIKKYGDYQVKQWRRSFTTIPPQVTHEDERFPGHDVRYINVKEVELPTAESLELTVNRVIPYWTKNIYPYIKKNKRVLITAHGNSIRAMRKFLDNLSEEEILEVNIPTGIPLVYEFEDNMFIPIKHYYIQ